MEENNNQKKERRVSFAAEVETVFEYEEHRPETTVSSEEEFTADLTYENSKQLSIFNETTILNEFMQKEVKDLVDPHEQNTNSYSKFNSVDPHEQNANSCSKFMQKDLEQNTNICSKFMQKDLEQNTNPCSPEEHPKFISSPKIKNFKKEEIENEVNLIESSVISNNSIEATEIINTQKLKFMIPQTKKQRSSITELFAKKGIMFLDTISFAKIRRDTLSKIRKPIEPSKILFYNNFHSDRIKFFDDFVEDLKIKNEEYENSIEEFVNANEEIEKVIESGKNLKVKILNARNLAKVSWYELRAKKELAFNELAIENKNKLQFDFNAVYAKYANAKSKQEEFKLRKEELKNKIQAIKEELERNKLDKEDYKHKLKDIETHQGLLENLKNNLEDLKVKYNKNLLHKQIQENQMKSIKREIELLMTNMKEVCINEDQLNATKEEFDKLSAIFNFKIKKVKKNYFEFIFQEYRIVVEEEDDKGGDDYDGEEGIHEREDEGIHKDTLRGDIHKHKGIFIGSYTLRVNSLDPNFIPGVFLSNLLKNQPKQSSLFNLLFSTFRIISILNEFFKELKNISLTETILKENEISFTIIYKNIKLCKTVSLTVLLNYKLEVLVLKEGETYLYNLPLDKGFLLDHLE